MTNVMTRRIKALKRKFPQGASVVVREVSRSGCKKFISSRIVGTVMEWRYQATGSWYATNGDPMIPNSQGKLQLLRLHLRKADGELSVIIFDDHTDIAIQDSTP